MFPSRMNKNQGGWGSGTHSVSQKTFQTNKMVSEDVEDDEIMFPSRVAAKKQSFGRSIGRHESGGDDGWGGQSGPGGNRAMNTL
mmetsp:Transcript_6790/g.7857  ORF Transcript_6790/g.7857 Transcript_6790/m.7857 type:complete len:84 (-) Transcript_6790:445-696(-)